MTKLKRLTALILCAVMLAAFVPQAAFAEEVTEETTETATEEATEDSKKTGIYSITNGYLTYTYNANTGGFAIETVEGHPKKQYDDKLPLLYAEDESRSNGTSFVSVQIDGDAYIFGQSYGFFGLATTIGEPEIKENGQLLEVSWTIKGITVTQQVALGNGDDTDTLGNAGISYEVTNNTKSDAEVNIRLLLDTALGGDIDAPYVVVDNEIVPVSVETEWSGDDVPDQIRNVDSIANSTKVSYLISKGWKDGLAPTRVIAGHWANMANTRYEYTADNYCDFTNQSNKYRTADAAISIYWEGQTLAAGESYSAETLYGIGNFSSDTGDMVGINVTLNGKVEVNDAGDGYLNDGKFSATIEIDNTLDESVNLDGYVDDDENSSLMVIIRTEEEYLKLLSDDQYTYTQLAKGESITIPIELQAVEQASITAGTFYVSVSGWAIIDGVLTNIETMTERSIIIPSVTGAKAFVDMSAVSPEIVYTSGEKAVTVTGKMSAFKSLSNAGGGWTLTLKHDSSDHEVVIDPDKVAFLDDTYTSMSFSTTEELEVGFYDIVFDFSNDTLKQAFGDSITAAVQLEVSADETYALKSYSIISLIRSTENNTSTYDFYTFTDEGDYLAFFEGNVTKRGLVNGGYITHDFGANKSATEEHEILLTVRGKVREMEDENGKLYWQADYADGPITINNILSYEGSEPLQLYENNNTYAITGNGILKVVNSITVWRSKWSYSVQDGILYTLNKDRISSLAGTPQDVTLSFDGAASMIQSLGGFLMDLSYGVMSSEWFDEGDGKVTYNIAFGGMVSIAISSKDNPDDEADNAGDAIKSADDDDEDFYIVDVKSGEVTSGSTKTTDTTTTTSSDGTKTKKKSALSGSQLSADIDEVMFGEMGNVDNGKVVVEGIGFEGINTTIKLGLPDNVLGSFIKNDAGLEVTMTINTLNNIYELDASVQIKIIECEATLGFKQVTVSGSDKVVPNNIAFKIKTEKGGVPLVTPVLYMTGLGGGIYNLADTIGGNFSSLPPVTISLYMALQAIQLLDGEFNATVNLSGLSITGELTFNGNRNILAIDAGISAQWITPWNLSLYGNADLLKGVITGGISVTLAQDYFYGYIYAAIKIPDDIWLVGGMELARVEAAVSNTFVGANVKLLGIKFGVKYYWDGGKFTMSKNVDLSAGTKTSMSIDEDGTMVTAVYGSNLKALKTTVIETDEDNDTTLFRLMDANSASKLTVDVEGTKPDEALLIAVPYTGGGMPSASTLTVTNPDGKILTLEPNDNNGGGNYLIQDVKGEGTYVFITVTDSDLICDGEWSVECDAENVTLSDIIMTSVENIPEITAMSYTYDANDPFALSVDWTTDTDRAAEGSIDVYLTDNANVLEELKTDDNKGVTLGYHLGQKDLIAVNSGSFDVTIPAGFENGEYYVVTTLTQEDGISTAISANSFKFTNPNLPRSVKSVNVKYGGNGDLYVEIEDADVIDYTDYLVEITAEDGTELTNNFNQYSIDEGYIYIGKEAALEAGKNYIVSVRTLREETITPAVGSTDAEETNYYYGEDIVSSDPYTMPEIAKPELLSVVTDFETVNGNIATDTVTVTYTFDRPVWMMLSSRGQSVYQVTNDFKEVWTFELGDMVDGSYIIDFTAYSKSKDYVTGADFPNIENAQIGFTVDTSAPLLTLSMTDAEDLDGNATLAALNVVTADAQGYYTFTGLTEAKAELTVDGKTDGLTVEDSGFFTYTGKLADDETDAQHLIKAVDKAGNVAKLMVYVISSKVTTIEKIELWRDGDKVSAGSFDLDVGGTADLKVIAYTSDGTEWEISGEDVVWEILYDTNIISFDDGSLTALSSGETAVKATLPTATVVSNGTSTTMGYEAYTQITVKPGLTVTYNANGGTGVPAKVTDLTAGEYTLNNIITPTHGDDEDGNAIVFIGWSETKDETIYKSGDTAPTTVTSIDLTADTIIYAVWGYDMNENGTADVLENTYTLTYDENGGTSVPAAETGLLAGEYTLSDTVPTHADDADGNEVIFIGWSLARDATIYTKSDMAPTTVTSVTIAKDTTVYAVWGLDVNENGVADVFEDTYTVSYNVNGGNGTVQDDTEVLAGAHKLSTAAPTHDDVNGIAVVFIGWSETQYGTIYSTIDDMPNVVEEITVAGDTTVYAAWGYDENENGVADIVDGAYTISYALEHVTLTNEAEYVIKGHSYTTAVTADNEHTISSVSVVMADVDVTSEVYDAANGIITIGSVTGDVVITIKAEQNRYTLSYDANDGDGAPTNEIGLLAGTHALSATVPTHDAVGGIDVIFIGWSLTKDSKIYAKGETAPATVTSVTIAGDTTVYAVWGYDENENGVVDANEETYTLTYDANDGDGAPAAETELLANTYALSNVIPTHADASGTKVVFIGWSEEKDAHIYTGGETAPTTVTRVTIAADTTVYAVWGYDANSNGTADVIDGAYTVTYTLENVELDNTAAYVIAKESYGANITVKDGYTIAEASVTMGGTDITDEVYDGSAIAIASVTGNVVITIKAELKRYTVYYDANGGDNAPTKETGVLAGTYNLNTAYPTHKDVNDTAVLFIGWSEAKYGTILAKGGTAPTTVTSVEVTGDVTVYAVWGYDENENGVADVLEETYTLTYDANDGTGAPTAATELLANTYALSEVTPTHTDVNDTEVIFIGWSEEKDAHVYAKNETMPTTVTSVTVTGDTTVYAVWGYDENENGTADVFEKTYTVTYDANNGTGAPADDEGLLTNTHHVLSTVVPTHGDVNNTAVVFIGWSTEQDGTIYGATSAMPTVVLGIDITGDATVYAVWGYDEDNNGTADIIDGAYTVTYDIENVTLTNEAEYVVATNAYTTTIKAYDGHTIASVVVTMGGEDITSEAYSGGTITIASVTGDVVITAKAALNRYTVYYDANGGDNAPTNDTGVLAGTHVLNTAAPTHEDDNDAAVIFIGWSEAKDAHIYAKNETAPTTITSVTVAGNVTVYAVWAYDENGDGTADVFEETYTVAYDANDGTGAPANDEGLLAGTHHVLSTVIPTHNNVNGTAVVFIGWSEAKDGTIYGATSAMPTVVSGIDVMGDATVYAVWGYDENGNGTADVVEGAYTVTYDIDNVTLTNEAEYVIAKSAYKTIATVHDGYTITSVTVTMGGEDITSAVYSGGTITIPAVTGDVTITVKAELKRYTVYYDANGGGNAPTNDTGVLAGTHKLNTAAPTHANEDGYAVVFIGWSEAQDSAIYSKTDAAPTTVTSVAITGDTTVYAVWGYDENGNGIADVLEGTYAISYTLENAEASNREAVVIAGDGYNTVVTANEGYVFASVTVTMAGKDITSEAYSAETGEIAIDSVTGDVVITAKAELIRYTVSYDANGGTGAPDDDTEIVSGTHHTLSGTVPTHDNYNEKAVVFIGWSTEQDGYIYSAMNEDVPNVIMSMTVTGDVTVYAVWGYDENGNGVADIIEGAHVITYSWDNITIDNEAEYVIANHSYTAKLTPNEGYAIASVTVTMAGYDITAEVYNAETNEITIANVTGEVTITAEAEILRYTVSYDANGGKGTMTDENSPYDHGTTAAVLENTFTRSSYKFNGWNTAADGSGTSYSAGDEFTVNADVTLYAQWKRTNSGGSGGGNTVTQYTVTFNANGGSEIGSVKVDRNDTLSEPEEPTKSGYEFEGWYTNAELTNAYDFETKVTESFTLYAKWTATESKTDDTDDKGHDCPSEKFTDVDTNLWYHEYIDYALDNGIMNGTSATTFEPNTAITRGMIVTMLYRLEGEPDADLAYGFDDVTMGMYYTEAVAWSAANEIVYGYGDGNFGPDDAITREQMAAIMYRYAGYKGYDVSVGEDTNILSFDDALEISEYAVPAMQWACGCGLIEGTGTALEPTGTATRAQAAAIFMRLCEMPKDAE